MKLTALVRRRHACATCPTPCAALKKDGLIFMNTHAVCPLGRWTFGLGDAVALVAQPIARTIDAVAGTNIAQCGGCTGAGGRKDRWNQAVPDVLRPFNRPTS